MTWLSCLLQLPSWEGAMGRWESSKAGQGLLVIKNCLAVLGVGHTDTPT